MIYAQAFYRNPGSFPYAFGPLASRLLAPEILPTEITIPTISFVSGRDSSCEAGGVYFAYLEIEKEEKKR